jgi:hypothetical protein
MWAIAAILRGHWSTKLLASVSLACYLLLLYVVIRSALADNWGTILQSWTS